MSVCCGGDTSMCKTYSGTYLMPNTYVFTANGGSCMIVVWWIWNRIVGFFAILFWSHKIVLFSWSEIQLNQHNPSWIKVLNNIVPQKPNNSICMDVMLRPESFAPNEQFDQQVCQKLYHQKGHKMELYYALTCFFKYNLHDIWIEPHFLTFKI